MPKGVYPRGTERQRFEENYTPEPMSGCYLWTACYDPAGYGVSRLDGRKVSAHRASWVFANGPIPNGLWVLHKCDVRECVRPQHLFLGTPADNVHDCVRKGRHARGDTSGARIHPERFPRGERHKNSKLNAAAVQEIRRAVAAGETKKAVANRFGVTRRTVQVIAAGISWAHVPMPDIERGRDAA